MIGSKKTAGILCEANGGDVHIGIGINVAQKEFPSHLREKATSIALALGTGVVFLEPQSNGPDERFCLLEKILAYLYGELETAERGREDWRFRLEQRLYKMNEQIVFIEGAAGSGKTVRGRLAGIGVNGELLIVPDGEIEPRSFITGEQVFL
jgi:BirA family biotin operon repressor/biotin-[acetyl-CoA-carboxylase] ligase